MAKDKKVYETTAGLGYRQKAYVIKINYSLKDLCTVLCIGGENLNDGDSFYIGQVSDLEDFYMEESDFSIRQSPLYNEVFYDFLIND